MEKLLFELSDVLDALEQWYKLAKPEHPYNDNFNGPASEEHLDELSSLLDEAELPDDLVQLYERFDGTWSDDEKLNQIIESGDEVDSLFEGNTFVPLAGPADSVIGELKYFEDDDYRGGNSKGPVKRMRFNRLWIPIAKDFSGNFIGVDLDPPTAGTYGQVIRFGRDEVPTVLAESLTEYLIKRCEVLSIEIAKSDKKSAKPKRHSKEAQLKKQLLQKKQKQDELDSDAQDSNTNEVAEASARIERIDSQIAKFQSKNDGNSNVVSIFSARSFKNSNQQDPSQMSDAKIESISLLAAEVVKDLYESRNTLAPDSDASPSSTANSSTKETIEKLGKLENLGKKVLRDPVYLVDGLKYLLECLNAKTEKKRVKAMEQINIIGSEKYFLNNDLPEMQETTVLQYLDRCLYRMMDFLRDGTDDEISEAMRTLSDLEYPAAINEIIYYLDNKQFSTEAAWCIGKFGTAAERAKPALLNTLRHKGAEEAALIALEKIGAIPEPSDEVIGAFIRSQDASIAATACMLVSRTPALAAKFTKYISAHLKDKRGRLHAAAELALDAAANHRQK